MHRIIVIQFISLDGVVEDPDGSLGTPFGGWAFRFGPEAVAGDKFRLGPQLDAGVLLFGRSTWQLFSRLWPTRTDDFSLRMNRARKRVVSRTLTDVSAWDNSAVVDGDPVQAASRLRREQDVIVIGSHSVVRALQAADLVDEYRLLIFPVVLGAGRRLFDGLAAPQDLQLTSVQQSGAAALLHYDCRPRSGARTETASLTGERS
jgi:dihydrofolate reductase